jgi:dipeptidyl aminopeptidase/acylaminoacyl peptidase
MSLTIDQILAIPAFGGAEAAGWSPDSTQISFVSGIGGTAAIWSAHPEQGTLHRLTVGSLGGGGLLTAYQPRWSPDGRFMAYVTDKSGGDEIWLWAADGSPERQVTTLGARIEGYTWAADSQSLLVSGNKYGAFDIFRVQIGDGQTHRLTSGSLYHVYPSCTPDGRVLYVELDADWVRHTVYLLDAAGGAARAVLSDVSFFDYHYGRTFGYPTVSPDGQHFLYRNDASGWFNIWLASVEGRTAPRRLAPAEADQTDAIWSPDGTQVAFVENHNGTLSLKLVDVAGGDARSLVAPDVGVCQVPSWSPDGKYISYLAGSPTSPLDLRLFEVADGSTRPLTSSLPGAGVAQRLAVPEKVRYRSFDDLEIAAYLYRPAGQGPYPGIVWVHGGPTSQYYDTFQAQVQFFVQQGYVVLLPNIRGSSGYGKAFEALNDRDWGGGDLQDVIAGAEYLKRLPEVDAANLGVTGTSYGGIMSMYAVSFAPDVFQAAVACSGYGDMLHMYGEQELRHIKLIEYELGKLPEAAETYRRCSAIYKVQQATTPCFVLHGEGGYPVSSSARNYALALESHYKPFWYKAYQGEHYYVRTTKNVRRMLLDMQAFFDFYLKGIPHNLPAAERPLTHLSGIGGPSGAAARFIP